MNLLKGLLLLWMLLLVACTQLGELERAEELAGEIFIGEVSVTDKDFARKISPTLFVEGDYIVICWEQGNIELGQNAIYCAESSDDGLSFSTKGLPVFSKPGWRLFPNKVWTQGDQLVLQVVEIDLQVFDQYDATLGEFFGDSSNDHVFYRKIYLNKNSLQLEKIGEIEWQVFYGSPMVNIVTSDGTQILPAYEYNRDFSSKNKIEIFIYVKNREGVVSKIEIPNSTGVKLAEPSVVEISPNRLWCFARSFGTGYIYYSESFDGGSTWSDFTPTSITSPSSISKLIKDEYGRVYLIYNNIFSLSQGPRNSLDLAKLNENMEIEQEINLLYSTEDFFSNFQVTVNSDEFYIVFQQLDRIREDGLQLDAIKLLKLK
ncbi:hypothetical protein NBRC116188_05580 [Oceaniserpentilla sp. 4NH20-0058]|uniref:sialidase family protein n=1 Tax=Oceaniserpentilla sp. 4NH20-0058 TaxID=3127660 RepID=UPI0031054A0C